MISRTTRSLRLVVCIAVLACAAYGQIADSAPAVVADIPVNYSEANAGTYTLPELLKLDDGRPVRDAKTWFAKRRPEIRKLIEENWFGRSPGRPRDMTFEVVEQGSPAFDGKAIRRQVIIYFTKEKTGPRMDLLVYLPSSAKGPVPVFLNMSFFANNLAVADPGVRVGRRWDRESRTQIAAEPPKSSAAGSGNRARRGLPVEQFLAQGIGVATFNKDDLAPDFTGTESLGVKAIFLKPGQTKPAGDEWGAIAAWAWGASRALDYFEKDKDIDARRVAIHGVSRLGKTALWAGAADERFAMVIASCSGEGGAAIARRNYGETLAHMSAPTRYPYQFAGNYAKFAKRVHEWPVDAHMLIAMIAPRPLLLQTGNTDKWSDPYGEFLAAVAAEPVYELLGKKGLGTNRFPAAGQPILHDLGYYMHDGGHGTVPSDFDVYLKFMQMHLQSMPTIDYARLGTHIVSALKLRKGERVLMRTDPAYFSEIVGPLQKQIRAAGGTALEPLPIGRTLTAEILERTDIFVELPITESGRRFTAAESAILSRWLDTGGAKRELHFHWSDGSRHADGLPDKHPREFDQLYETALDIDYRALDALQNRAIEILRLGSVRIQTPAGTDLFFRTGARPFNKQNGDASSERVRGARVRVDREIELPAGVLRVAPIEESVFGQIVIPEARFGNAIAKGVVLQLDNGRITRVRAKEGQEAVEQALSAGGEAAYRFREFGLGFNPKLSESTGTSIPYYGYGAGVVRLSLGDNEELGGKVRGGFVRWFFFPDATVHVDFRYLIRDGKLVLKPGE